MAAQLVIHVVALLLLARLVEPLWGGREFVKFLLFVVAASGAATFAVLFLTYLATQNGKIL